MPALALRDEPANAAPSQTGGRRGHGCGRPPVRNAAGATRTIHRAGRKRLGHVAHMRITARESIQRSVAAQPPRDGITNTSRQYLFPKHFHHPHRLNRPFSPAPAADACRASPRGQSVRNAGLPLFDFRRQARLLDASQPFRTLPICSDQLNGVLQASSLSQEMSHG